MTTIADSSLQQQLDELKKKSAERLGPEIAATFKKAVEELVRSGIAERGLKAGAPAPNFSLPDHQGKTVQLSDLLARGPAVIAFYRGTW